MNVMQILAMAAVIVSAIGVGYCLARVIDIETNRRRRR